MSGDYFEGLEEGIKIGRREALDAMVSAASRPAGNRHMDFSERQSIIVARVHAAASMLAERRGWTAEYAAGVIEDVERATLSTEPHVHEWREIAVVGGSRWACVCGADRPQPTERESGA